MPSPLNVAAPLGPVVAVGPLTVASADPDAIVAMTTVPLWPTGLPLASCSCTTGCWVNVTPLCAVLDGSVVSTSLAAVPAVMLNAALVALVSVPEVAVSL